MQFTDRIKKIKKYFNQFNIIGEVAFVAMKFPEKWMGLDYSEIGKKYGVVIEEKNGQLLFFIDAEAEVDGLFDAIDEIIQYNEQAELKTALLRKKAQELTTLFATESLEKLETLCFTFEKKKAIKTKKKAVQKENTEKAEEVKPETSEETEKPVEKKTEKKKNNKTELVNFVEETVVGGK